MQLPSLAAARAAYLHRPTPSSARVQPFSILVICSGNICRSAMAHAFMAHTLGAQRRTDVVVGSAGTSGIWQHRPEPTILSVIRETVPGFEHDPHKATPAEVAQADLILCMTGQHLAQMAIMFPGHVARLRLYTQLVDCTYDIADPFPDRPGGAAPLNAGHKPRLRKTANLIRSIAIAGLTRTAIARHGLIPAGVRHA